MGIQRYCEQCGWALPAVVRGRPPKICGECKRGRRRIKERSATCCECGMTFVPPAQTGMKPKRCRLCSETHERDRNTRRQAEWRKANPERNKEHQDRYNRKRLADPDHLQYKRDNELRRAYGITRAKLNEMLEAQGHRCAVCRGEHVGPGTRLHVDHCHDTGRVRGLLCAKCNTLIGLAGDDPERLEIAAQYLRGSNADG